MLGDGLIAYCMILPEKEDIEIIFLGVTTRRTMSAPPSIPVMRHITGPKQGTERKREKEENNCLE